ncbi:hypothetical protein GQX73_g7054 [Xylaria multiplex]|uniref:Tesmin/TSO1-like CXC domain-containing protein n=1 Tax=Xylaria multiplex TaxID=323545 RepID=A0A7C8MRX6_9PEZI|nr:hypothetical protein GQX73_g7054 [Xylaria multiplex]
MDGSGVNTMRRLHPNGVPAVRPVSWSAIPADDPAAHEQMIKYISESIVDGMQGNISSGFMKQVQASKKSAMSPHDKAERMRIVRRMRTTLERLTEELGQKFFEEFRERPAVGRWYDSWLLHEPPTFLRWEEEWALPTHENLAAIDVRSVGGSIDERVFGSETTPEVRVDFSEDPEEYEDTQEEFAQVPEYRADAPVAETKTDGPAPSSTGCKCEHVHEGSGSEQTPHLCQTCACSNQGYGCIASCGCDETCQNNFNNIALDNILGTDSSGLPVKLDPCFITYLQKHKLDGVITLDSLFDHLLSGLDYVPDGNDEAIDAWRVTWETGYNGPDPEARTEELQPMASGREAGSRASRYGTAEPVGAVANRKSGTAENATSARMEERSHVADAGGVSNSYHEAHKA